MNFIEQCTSFTINITKEGYPWIITAATYMGIWGMYGLKMFKNYIIR